MIEKIKQVKVWVASCPYCIREIEGSTKEQVEWNLNLHIKKHKQEEEDERNNKTDIY